MKKLLKDIGFVLLCLGVVGLVVFKIIIDFFNIRFVI